MECVREVMTGEPVCVDVSTSIARAAEIMRERDVGDVVVTQGGQLYGILTDRDIVVRAIAQDRDLSTPVSDICTAKSVVTVGPDDAVDLARDRMRKKAIRRVIVVEDEQPVGIVSLGDLAIERAPRSLLGRISAAPSNN